MKSAAKKSDPMGTERGRRSATPLSPDYPANKKNEPPEPQYGAAVRLGFNSPAIREVTRRRMPSIALDTRDEDEGAEIEIEGLFRRRLSALRRMPRYERPHALRAAREWRQLALKAIREKRAAARHAQHLLRRLTMPAPGS